MINNQLKAKFGPLQLELLDLLNPYFLKSILQVNIAHDLIFKIYPNEHMIILVMFKCNSIPHQQQFIRQSSVTKIYLRTFLKLIFSRAQHIELIEFILFPCFIEIWLVVLHNGWRLVFFYGFFLSHSISIVLPIDTVIKLLDFLDVLDISWMNFFTFFLPLSWL